MIPGRTPDGALSPSRSNHAGLVKGGGPDKGQSLSLQVGVKYSEIPGPY